MAEIEEALFVRATTFAGLQALVGARFYPLRLPPNVTLPAGTYQRIGGPRFEAAGSDTGIAQQRIQVDWYAETYAEVKAVARQARLAFERWSDDAADPRVLDTYIDRDTDIDEPSVKNYRVSQDFTVLHAE